MGIDLLLQTDSGTTTHTKLQTHSGTATDTKFFSLV